MRGEYKTSDSVVATKELARVFSLSLLKVARAHSIHTVSPIGPVGYVLDGSFLLLRFTRHPGTEPIHKQSLVHLAD